MIVFNLLGIYLAGAIAFTLGGICLFWSNIKSPLDLLLCAVGSGVCSVFWPYFAWNYFVKGGGRNG